MHPHATCPDEGRVLFYERALLSGEAKAVAWTVARVVAFLIGAGLVLTVFATLSR